MAKIEEFPIKYLWRGYHILKSQGRAAFLFFCDEVDMPDEDRERVSNKLKYEQDPEFRDLIKGKLRDICRLIENGNFKIDEDEIPF